MEGYFCSVLNNLDSGHLDSIDSKLSDAINLYTRKSQVEELFKGYLHAFGNNEHDVLWMPKTLKSFRSCCKGLHFETVIRVWTILNDELKKATFEEIEAVDVNVFPVLRLFTEFIKSICLSQVPEKALAQITACIVDTQEMTVGFIELCLGSKDASHMTHFLHLLTIIGELIFKFPMLYQQFLLRSEPCQESNKLFSIGSIIVGFSDKKASKVHAFMISQPDRIAFLGWLNLLLFKVKCSSLNLWSNEALIALCDFVVLDLLESIDFSQSCEYTSMLWSTLCCSYHSIFETSLRTNNPSCQKYNSTFSKKLVQGLCHRGTYQDTTNRFFSNLPNSDVTSDLLNELCSQFLEKLSEIFRCKKKRSKKMKNGLATDTMAIILESLNQTLPQLLQSSTQDSISLGLQSLLDESIILLSNKSQESFSYSDDLLYILEALLNYLVPFMNRLQKMKCSIVSVMILCRGPEGLSMTTRCLLIIANSLHHIKCTNLLLKYISPATFCSWILSLYDYFSSDDKEVLLCRKLCRRIFDSFVSAVLKNVVELKKTKVFFQKICKESHDYSNSNFEHLLITSNLICRALNQQSIEVECSSVLKKITKKLLLKTYSCFESFHEMNIEEWFFGEGKRCLPLVMETMVSLLKHSKLTGNQSGKENELTKMNIFKQVLSFKNYPLIIIKKTDDPDILLNCIDFIKEICIGQSDTTQNEFLDEAFDTICQKLRALIQSNSLVSSNPLEICLSELASLLMLSMNKEKLSIALQKIFSSMDSKSVNWQDVHCIMQVWQSLLDQKIAEGLEETMIYSCQHIVISIQKLLLRNPPAYVMISMLNTLSALVNKKPNFLLIQDLSILLHFAHSINLESFPSKSLPSAYKMQLAEFVAVFQSYYKVLDSILSSHPESVKCLVPTLTAATKKLLQASMWGGQQVTGVTLSQDDLQDLEKCARSVERLAASMQEYKLDFTKVAHLLVAEFADCSQKLTLYPVIKMPLLQAVYLWLDMCDEHTTAQLQIALSTGAKEIYRDIYNEFTKYHKYRG